MGLSSVCRGGASLDCPGLLVRSAYFDAAFRATQRVFDWKSIQKYRSSAFSEGVAQHDLQDARDLVVLATGNAYLVKRLRGLRGSRQRRRRSSRRRRFTRRPWRSKRRGCAGNRHASRAGEYQSRQQQLIAATNDFAKQKISLARVIGLAPGRNLIWRTNLLIGLFRIPDLETSLQRAYSMRSDYKAAQDRLVAAQLERSAATAGYFPTIDVAANFGEIGAVPGDVLPTYGLFGTVNIPIFQGGKVHGDVLKADAGLRQAEAQLADVRAKSIRTSATRCST